MPRWNTLNGAPPRVIAHRGASGHRPEHTLDAYALAAAQGADAIEPDVVSSRDGVLFARHDLGLARSTDVAAQPAFAARARALAGQHDWWVGDFSAAEIDTLRAIQPSPGRSAEFDGRFSVPRFSQVLAFARDAGVARGRPLIVDAEIKQPEFFATLGIDVLGALHGDLAALGLLGPQAPVWIESFDHAFLRRAHERCGNPCFPLLETLAPRPDALAIALPEFAQWARGIAPAKYLLWDERGGDAGLVASAHALKLEVHAWTFRDDRPPAPFATAREELLAAFALGVDAVFCDFPDTALALRAAFRDDGERAGRGRRRGDGP